MSTRTDWQLRYRSPLSPTKGVDDVLISTDTDDEKVARQVADHFLATKMGHPSTRFVFVRHAVVMTEAQMRKEKQPAAESEADPREPGRQAAQPHPSEPLSEARKRVGQ